MSLADVPEPVGEVGLTEPTRQRLLGIAADLVGRLGPEEIPPGVRPIARFTSAKRARLGATVLASALDGDAGFRARVAAVVQEGSPQLVEAVLAGSSTTAADPLDIAIVAYLFRPDGWTATVAGANARWSREREQAGAAAGDSARLRVELAQARAQLKAETSRARIAAAAVRRELAADLAEARRQVRVRTAELRSAERVGADALAQLALARQERVSVDAAHDSEIRRLRSRIAELERTAEAVRHEARTARELDDTRLWLLLETLADAAAGIRRELSLPVPARRPADTVGSAAPGEPDRRTDDPATVERLLALPNAHVIVDGYNVTKTGYGELPLAAQRIRLSSSMAKLGARCGAEITVVFDGGARPPVQAPTPRGVRVLFSRAEEIADDVIRRLVVAEPVGRPIVVVTSDQQVVGDVRRAGAWAVPSAVLLALLG